MLLYLPPPHPGYRRGSSLAVSPPSHCFPPPHCAQVQSEMAIPPRSCFQFFGLDFLLDTALKPW